MFTVDRIYIYMEQERNRVHKRAAKFANNIDESGWETLAQRRLIAEYAPFSRNTPGDGLGKRQEIDF